MMSLLLYAKVPPLLAIPLGLVVDGIGLYVFAQSFSV